MTSSHNPDRSSGTRLIETTQRLGFRYTAGREALEPLLRIVLDMAALVALLRRRPALRRDSTGTARS